MAATPTVGSASGFSERRFALAKTEAGVEVVEMTGPKRG
jgi:hypothetical protein